MIEVIGLKLENHTVPVPVGLSELLANAWVKTSTVIPNKEYDRQVIKRGDQLVTRLKKRG